MEEDDGEVDESGRLGVKGLLLLRVDDDSIGGEDSDKCCLARVLNVDMAGRGKQGGKAASPRISTPLSSSLEPHLTLLVSIISP